MRKTQIESVLEQGPEENIWTQEGESKRIWGKLHKEELHNVYSSKNTIRVSK